MAQVIPPTHDQTLDMAELNTLSPKLPVKDQEFAKSLISQFNAKGGLSEKQWPWVTKLLEKLQPQPAAPTRAEKRVKVYNVTGVLALFQTAQSKLKQPMITMNVADIPLQMKMAPKYGKNPDHIYLRNADVDAYYGKITPTGDFVPSAAGAELSDMFEAFFDELSADPAKVAAEWGKLEGRCCFCNKHLKDPTSVAVGYGKECAGHWGLPWSKKLGKPSPATGA